MTSSTGWTVVATVAAGVAVAAVPDLRRPVLTAGGAAVALAVAAAVTRLRALRHAGGGPDHLVRPAGGGPRRARTCARSQVVAAGVLLLGDAGGPGAHRDPRSAAAWERPPRWSSCAGPRPSRLGVAAAAVGASSLVAATAAQTVVPSVGLVLGGLVAAVAALVVTTRAHRDEPANDGPDVHESLSGRVPRERQR